MKKNSKKYRIEYANEKNGLIYKFKEEFDILKDAMDKREQLVKQGKHEVCVKNNFL